jgi:glutamate dehydrogenase
MEGVDNLVESTTRWYLQNAPGADISSTIAYGRAGFESLLECILELGNPAWRSQHEAEIRRLEQLGVPDNLALIHAFRKTLIHAPHMIAAAQTTGRSMRSVGRAFYILGEKLRLSWIEDQLYSLPAPSRMQRWALQAVREDVRKIRRDLAQMALEAFPDSDADHAVAQFLQAYEAPRQRFERFASALAIEGGADLTGLTLAVRQLQQMVE